MIVTRSIRLEVSTFALLAGVSIQGCMHDPHHYINIRVGDEVARARYESGPHYIYHVIVDKPAGQGWRTLLHRDTSKERVARYWKDVSTTHTMAAEVRETYPVNNFKNVQDLLSYARQDVLDFALKPVGEVESYAMTLAPGARRCVTFDAKLRSKKFGPMMVAGALCGVEEFPSSVYSMTFSEASDGAVDASQFNAAALKFFRGVRRAEPGQRALLESSDQ